MHVSQSHLLKDYMIGGSRRSISMSALSGVRITNNPQGRSSKRLAYQALDAAAIVDGTHADPEWQKSSGLTKRCPAVPEIHGIPCPKEPRIKWDGLGFTLLAIGLITLPFLHFSRLKENQFVQGVHLVVEVQNCHVLMQEKGDRDAGLILQYWPFMGTMSSSTLDGQVHVKAMMRSPLSSWFRCTVLIVAPVASESLQSVKIRSHAAEFFTNVLLEGGKVEQMLSIHAGSHTIINIEKVHCDGEVRIDSKTNGIFNLQVGAEGSRAEKWSISSRTPVYIRASSSILVRGANDYSSLEAADIHESRGGFLLCPSQSISVAKLASRRLALEGTASSISETSCEATNELSFSSLGNAGLHVHMPCADCQVKRWKSALQFTAEARQALEQIRELITEHRKSPWMAVISVTGLQAKWTLASTPACLYFNPMWLAVLSFGLLGPEIAWQELHLVGDFNMTGEDLEDDGFLLRAAHLDEHCPGWGRAAAISKLIMESLSPNGTVHFHGSGPCRNGLAFDRSSKGIIVQWIQGVPLMIRFAILSNFLCSCALAGLVLKAIRSIARPFLLRRVADRDATVLATQRLQNSLPITEQDLQVEFIDYPERGLKLSWMRPAEARAATAFRVGCRCLQSQARISLDLPAADVLQLRDKCYCFLSLQRAGLEATLEDVVVQVTPMSDARVLCSTRCSTPTRIQPLRGVAHAPWDLLSVLKGPSHNASLAAFLRTACSHFIPPSLTVVLDKIHIVGDKDDVTQTMLVEMFFGEDKKTACAATTAGLEESYVCSRPVKPQELCQESPATGWAGQDYFGVDILPTSEAVWTMTPPYRHGMRFGTALRINVISEEGQALLAAGQVDWNDMLDASEATGHAFTVQVDLIDVDGDVIGALCMQPRFWSRALEERGLKGMAPQDNRFSEDVFGDIYHQGMDRLVLWTSDRCDDCDNWQCNFWLEQLGRSELELVAQDLRFISETFPWVVDADFSSSAVACCRLVMEKVVGKQEEPLQPRQEAILCTSNWFIAVETVHLPRLELAYAAFCRMNNMEMAAMQALTLQSCGIQTREVSVRGCSDLRQPLPFRTPRTWSGAMAAYSSRAFRTVAWMNLAKRPLGAVCAHTKFRLWMVCAYCPRDGPGCLPWSFVSSLACLCTIMATMAMGADQAWHFCFKRQAALPASFCTHTRQHAFFSRPCWPSSSAKSSFTTTLGRQPPILERPVSLCEGK